MADQPTIDRLQIEVESKASNAKEGITSLKTSLEQLKSACKGGCGLRSITNSLNNLQTSLNQVDNSMSDKLSSLVDAMSKLQGLGKFNLPASFGQRLTEITTAINALSGDESSKILEFSQGLASLAGVSAISIPKSIAQQMTEIGAAVEVIPADTTEKLQTFAQGLGALSGVSNITVSKSLGNNLLDVGAAAELLADVDLSNMETLANAISLLSTVKVSATLGKNLSSLGQAASALSGMDFSGLENLVEALEPLSNGMEGLGATIPEVTNALEELSDQAEEYSDNAKQSEKSTFSLTAGMAAAFVGVKKLGDGIAALIAKSNNFIETYNLFSASMGRYAEQAEKYTNKVSDAMGINPDNWMRAQGTFMTLATGFGVVGDRALTMSQNLTQLGYDLSSFFNIAVEGEGGAMQKLQAGFSGELEPLRRLGFDLSQVRLQAIATSLGIQKTFNEMTQAEKAQLRYYAIMTQVTTAQGDMARTLDTPANQLRVLKAQVEQAGRAFGNIFIPALNAVLPYVIAVANAVRILANAIASLFGFQMPEVDYSGITTTIVDAADGAEDLEEGLAGSGKAAKKLKELLADWDELNIIQSESGGGSGSGSGSGAVVTDDGWTDFNLPTYDFLGGLVESRADSILKKMQPALTWITDHLTEIRDLSVGVGAAILEWSLAKKFFPSLTQAKGWLTEILGVVAAIAIEAATIALNITFTTTFLESTETKTNWGAFLGGLVTDIVGSSLVGRIVASAFTGKSFGATAGTITTGISFLINGMVAINLAIDDREKRGFTLENLLTTARGILETSLGAYFVGNSMLTTTFGGTLNGKEKRALGAAAFMLSTNVALHLELTRDVLNDGHEKIGETMLKIGADILQEGGTAAGVGLAFNRLMGKEWGWRAAGAVLALDAAMSLKLSAEDAAAEGFDLDNILTLAKGALEAAGAGWLVTHITFPGYEMAGAGAALVAAIGIGASFYGTSKIAETDKDDAFNWEGWLAKGLGDAVTIGGVSLLAKNAFGWDADKTLTATGVAIAISSAVNLVTTFGKVSADGWNSQTMWSALMDEVTLIVGAGLALSHLIPGFGTVGWIITGGVLAASVAATLIIALNSINANVPETVTINWGDSELTDEQIQTKVNSYFPDDVTAHIKSITLELDSELSTSVSGNIDKVNKAITGIKIGMDKNASLATIKTALIGENGEMGDGTLIGDVKNLIQQNAVVVTDFIKITGSDDTSLASAITGSAQNVSTELTNAGALWGQYFADGFEGEVEQAANNVLSYIMDISQAALKGQRQAEFDVAFGNLGLGDMTRETASSVLKGYVDIENDLLNAYIEDEQATYTSLMSQYAAQKTMIDEWAKGHPNDPEGKTMPQEYRDNLKLLEIALYGEGGTAENPMEGSYAYDIMHGYQKAQESFAEYISPARQKVLDEFFKVFDIADRVNWSDGRMNKGADIENDFNELYQMAFNAATATNDASRATRESELKDNLETYLTKLLEVSLEPDDFKSLQIALDAGLVSVFDFFHEDFIDKIVGLPDFGENATAYGAEMQEVLRSVWYSAWKEQRTTPERDSSFVFDAYDTLFGGQDGASLKTVNDSLGTTSAMVDTHLTGVESTMTAIKTTASQILGRMTLPYGRPTFGVLGRMAAAGGTFDTGELFVAREAGAEMVGRIGRRTSVANNEQIEDGIAIGVRTANEETNEAIRESNRYLRILAGKRFTLEPSTALARTVKRSEEMRLASEGV